jgi:hypothetical protein
MPILTGQIDGRLSNLKQWLVNLDVRSIAGEGVSPTEALGNAKLRDNFFQLFNAFVPGIDVRFAGVDRKTWQVNVSINGAVVSIDQVSQGTSSVFGWVGALLQRMYEIHGTGRDIRQLPAVVLIDEIDAHLHPEWQQRIVRTLSEQFGAVQFVASTHSPLIVGELERHQIFRMERGYDGEVAGNHPLHPVRGQGVAGLLTGEMFGLSSTVDTATQELLEKQRTLSLGDDLTEAERSELKSLSAQLDDLGFAHQARDPEYAAYLRQRHERLKHEVGAEPAVEPPSVVPPAVKTLIENAVARVRDERA